MEEEELPVEGRGIGGNPGCFYIMFTFDQHYFTHYQGTSE